MNCRGNRKHVQILSHNEEEYCLSPVSIVFKTCWLNFHGLAHRTFMAWLVLLTKKEKTHEKSGIWNDENDLGRSAPPGFRQHYDQLIATMLLFLAARGAGLFDVFFREHDGIFMYFQRVDE